MLNIKDDTDNLNCFLSYEKKRYHKLTSREVFVEINESVRVRNFNVNGRAESVPTIWNPGGEKKKFRKNTTSNKYVDINFTLQ